MSRYCTSYHNPKRARKKFCKTHRAEYRNGCCVMCVADAENIKRGYKPWSPTQDREPSHFDFRFREGVGF